MDPLDVNAYRARQESHFTPLISQYGGSHRAVDWGSQGSQCKRFSILCSVGDMRDASVLDVGCGTGAMVDYLRNHNFTGSYRGIDILPEMIEVARKNFPEEHFEACTIEALPADYHPDYVVESGIFTHADQAWLEATVRQMFERCRVGVAFNMLSSWSRDLVEDNEFSADPSAILTFARELTTRVVVRHDYMPHDFTVYLYKESS